MTIKASAGSAMLFAAGLLLSLAGSAPAIAAGDADSTSVSKSEETTSAKSARHGSRYAHRKHTRTSSKSDESKAASKSDESKKVEEKQVADAGSAAPPAIPDWLANANAQMTAADPSPDSAKGMSAAMSEKANTVLQAAADKPADAPAPTETGVIPSDQLNDVDRALQETPASEPAATQTVAVAIVKPAADAAAQAAANDSSTLDKTSLIGKIFIAFGALLTMASAARMFMA